jgi:hypothetical protein
MRLRAHAIMSVPLVTLPETTPVSEAAALREDLRCPGIEPAAWIINRALTGSDTRDPLLARRMAGEAAQIARIRRGLLLAGPSCCPGKRRRPSGWRRRGGWQRSSRPANGAWQDWH